MGRTTIGVVAVVCLNGASNESLGLWKMISLEILWSGRFSSFWTYIEEMIREK